MASSGNKNAAQKPKPTRSTQKKNKPTTSSPAIRGGKVSRRQAPAAPKTAAPKRPAATRRTPAPTKPPTPPQRLTPQQRALIIGLLLLFGGAVMVLSLLSPNQGQLTAALAQALQILFGWGSPAIPVGVGAAGLYLVLWGMDQSPRLPVWRLLGVAALFAAFELLATLYVQSQNAAWPDVWAIAQSRLGGGYLGSLLTWLTTSLAGVTGATIMGLTLSLLGVVGMAGVERHELQAAWARLRLRQAAPSTRPTPAAALEETSPPETETPQAESEPTPAAPPIRAPRRADPARPTPAAEPTPIFIDPRGLTSNNPNEQWQLPTLEAILESGAEGELAVDQIRDQANIIERTLESFGAPAELVETSHGPTVTMYGVRPLYIESRGGKRTKVKVSKIAGLADDLALALAAKSVRIQAPVPGKGYVGIEVPNTHKTLVSLRDVMESTDFLRINSHLRIGLGQDVAGQSISADLAKMPHLLVAGATGSGKSVCVNAIITCLLLQNTPDDLRFVMVDPKRVELTSYNGIPHLAASVVTEMERVIGALQWALREMDHRYQLFASAGTRHIAAYNKKALREGQARLPYIVIIIDELADLMLTAPEDAERALARLAQMARATGIHLILATQRPSVDVVTGVIKANFPARIAFAVASAVDSRVILDSVGAERLLGQGDMLFQRPDAPAPIRMQGCFVSDAELNTVIDYWKTARRFQRITAEAAEPRPESRPPGWMTMNEDDEEDETVVERPGPRPHPPAPPPATTPPPAPFQQPLWEHLAEQEEKAASQEEDDLLSEAIIFVQKVGKASTSMLQRRFRIGYTRAARMMDILEERGLIGPPTGTSKARVVVGTDEDEVDSANGDENEIPDDVVP